VRVGETADIKRTSTRLAPYNDTPRKKIKREIFVLLQKVRSEDARTRVQPPVCHSRYRKAGTLGNGMDFIPNRTIAAP
jgi:hypothetical protein